MHGRIGRARTSITTLMVVTSITLAACGGSSGPSGFSSLSPTDTPDTRLAPSAEFNLPVEDGIDYPLSFTSAVIENGNLVVRLAAAYEGIEPFGEELLITENGELPARMVIHSNNDVDLIFEGVTEVAGTAVMTNVNQTRDVDINVRVGSGSFTIPHGTDVTEYLIALGRAGGLRYSSTTPTSTTISRATISDGSTTIGIRGASGTYAASGEARNFALDFPDSAIPLLSNPDAILHISEVKQVVRYEIDLAGN